MRLKLVWLVVMVLTGCTSAVDVPEAAKPSVQPSSSVAESEASAARQPKTRSLRTEPHPGEVVFYQLHPNWRKVDRYCGAFDRSYVVRHVPVPHRAQNVLTRALRALFVRHWHRPESQVVKVIVEDGQATIDLRSMRGIGFAGTTCGGVSFIGSLLRTAFQFNSVHSVAITLRGSCVRFEMYMQAAPRCSVVTRGELER